MARAESHASQSVVGATAEVNLGADFANSNARPLPLAAAGQNENENENENDYEECLSCQ